MRPDRDGANGIALHEIGELKCDAVILYLVVYLTKHYLLCAPTPTPEPPPRSWLCCKFM